MVRRALFLLFPLVFFGGALLWGQQPKRKPEPYVAPLLPAELAWAINLTASPAAGGAMDAQRVYIPLQHAVTTIDGERIVTPNSATITALVRQTGAVAWTAPLESVVPPVVDGDRVFVATATELHALDAASGVRAWSVPVNGRIRAPMLVRAGVLVALIDPDELIAVRLDTREIAWRSLAGSGGVSMTADDGAVYVTMSNSRIVRVMLADGKVAWERQLRGTLSPPAIGRDRLVVGSTADSLWALDPESGDEEWMWPRRIIGGDVVGATVRDDVVYFVSLDNMVQALNRGNGNQLWKQPLPTQPIHPPRAFFGTVVVTGLSPAVSTFLAKGGTPVATWTPPPPTDAELEGPPLIDEHLKPFGVAMVVILRDGRVAGARPTTMTFPDAFGGPPKFVPGRTLPPDRLP